MAGTRKLSHGEKRINLFTSEKGRDRANARRAIEALQQGDQSLAHLAYQSDLMLEQTHMLRYLCDRLTAIERELQSLRQASNAATGAPGVSRPAPPPPPPPS